MSFSLMTEKKDGKSIELIPIKSLFASLKAHVSTNIVVILSSTDIRISFLASYLIVDFVYLPKSVAIAVPLSHIFQSLNQTIFQPKFYLFFLSVVDLNSKIQYLLELCHFTSFYFMKSSINHSFHVFLCPISKNRYGTIYGRR